MFGTVDRGGFTPGTLAGVEKSEIYRHLVQGMTA